MKTISLLFLLALATQPATAGISLSGSASGAAVIVVASAEPRAVAVWLPLPADFVSVPVRVISDQKNTALAYEESRQALELIAKKAAENGRFQTSLGVVTLAQRQSSFGISSGSWNQPAASTELHLLVPFTKERDNIFAAGAEAARFLENLSLPGKVRCELGRLQLAVNNPEQHRAKLLGLIAEEIKNTRQALAPTGTAKIEGLASPVLVRQTDDRNVELFLAYSFSITADK